MVALSTIPYTAFEDHIQTDALSVPDLAVTIGQLAHTVRLSDPSGRHASISLPESQAVAFINALNFLIEMPPRLSVLEVLKYLASLILISIGAPRMQQNSGMRVA